MVPLGIMLIRIVCWASEQLARARRGPADDLLVLAAYVGLAVVTLIGLIVDWLPLKTAAGDGKTAPQVLAIPGIDHSTP